MCEYDDDGWQLLLGGIQDKVERNNILLEANKGRHHTMCWECGWHDAPYVCIWCRQFFCRWCLGPCFWCDEFVCGPHRPPRLHNCRCLPRNRDDLSNQWDDTEPEYHDQDDRKDTRATGSSEELPESETTIFGKKGQPEGGGKKGPGTVLFRGRWTSVSECDQYAGNHDEAVDDWRK